MPSYDFNAAFSDSPMRFQQFACAVVSKREKCVFQRFGEGPDGGKDGVYVSEEGKTILQAKRTSLKGKALLNMLKRERKRIAPGSCSRYILVLSPKNISDELKEEICAVFPEIQSTNDIISGTDLNGYLEAPEYASVEKEYRELWLCSGNYLEEMLGQTMSKELLKRSRVRIRLAEEEWKTFVETEAFQEALNILESYQRVVISGDPGAGKTAHARCLADFYITVKKYEELYFVDSLGEIDRILCEESGKKTVIVFDDFWGHSTFSESRLDLNEEEKLKRLFQALPSYPNVRLIFTTREFVLRQGFLHFPELEEVCEIRKINLKLNTYTLAQKAEILYRHLDDSDLEYCYVEEIFRKREQIIYCEAYSPRSVSYFLKNILPGDREPEEYAKELIQYVEAPKKYFEEIFMQISYGAKLLCFLVLLSEEEIRISPELRKGFMNLADACGGKAEKERFENYLREVEGVFAEVRESEYEEDVLVLNFLNHSIRDFVKEYLEAHIEAYEMLLAEKCLYFNQLLFLVQEIKVSEECKELVIQRLVSERNQLKYSYVFNSDVNQYYYMDAGPEAYEEHKIWKLSVLFHKAGNAFLAHFLKEYCDSLLERIYKKEAGHEEMEAVVNLIPQMCSWGYSIEPEKLLEAYYKNIRWASELDWIDYLKDCCDEVFDKFIAQHLTEIRNFLPELVLEDIDYLLDEPNGEEEIDFLLWEVPELFAQYGIPYTKGYEKTLYDVAERPLPQKRKKKKFDWKEEDCVSEYEIEKENYQSATKKAKQWLLPQANYLSPKEIKEMEYADGKNYRKSYLTKGSFSKEDFLLVMEYSEHLEKLPAKEHVFYDGLADYLLREWTEEKKKSVYTWARKLAESGNFYFKASFFKDCEDLSERDGILEELLASGLLHRKKNWYYFWNHKLILFLALRSMKAMSEEEKQAYYQEDIWDCLYGDEERKWAFALKEYAWEEFEKYLVIPIFHSYLAVLEAEPEPVNCLLEKMEIEGVLHQNEANRIIGIVFYMEKAMEVYLLIDSEGFERVLDSYESLLSEEEECWKEFGETEEDRKVLKIRRLLNSPKGMTLLKKYGCLDAAGSVVDRMRQHLESFRA